MQDGTVKLADFGSAVCLPTLDRDHATHLLPSTSLPHPSPSQLRCGTAAYACPELVRASAVRHALGSHGSDQRGAAELAPDRSHPGHRHLDDDTGFAGHSHDVHRLNDGDGASDDSDKDSDSDTESGSVSSIADGVLSTLSDSSPCSSESTSPTTAATDTGAAGNGDSLAEELDSESTLSPSCKPPTLTQDDDSRRPRAMSTVPNELEVEHPACGDSESAESEEAGDILASDSATGSDSHPPGPAFTSTSTGTAIATANASCSNLKNVPVNRRRPASHLRVAVSSCLPTASPILSLEQLSATRAQAEAADVWALGVTLFACRFGHFPWDIASERLDTGYTSWCTSVSWPIVHDARRRVRIGFPGPACATSTSSSATQSDLESRLLAAKRHLGCTLMMLVGYTAGSHCDVSAALVDLLVGMLDPEPSTRLTMAEVESHSWFRSGRDNLPV